MRLTDTGTRRRSARLYRAGAQAYEGGGTNRHINFVAFPIGRM